MIPTPRISQEWDDDLGCGNVKLKWEAENRDGVVILISIGPKESKFEGEEDALWAYSDSEVGYAMTGEPFWLRDGVPRECLEKIMELNCI